MKLNPNGVAPPNGPRQVKHTGTTPLGLEGSRAAYPG
jgi:hypothetical protein